MIRTLAIDFDDSEERSLGVLSRRLRMDPNHSKTPFSIFKKNAKAWHPQSVHQQPDFVYKIHQAFDDKTWNLIFFEAIQTRYASDHPKLFQCDR